MANRFFEYYNDELAALRQRAARFAESYPKIAGRLRIAPETSDDPHVERLVQSFAYSAARVRQKLDDSLPELTNGLLETLYPNYLAPYPATSIVEMPPHPMLDAVQIVPRGTEIASEPIEGDICRFRTTQDIHLAPIALSDIKVMSRPFDAPPAPDASAAACLRITITPKSKPRLHEIGLERLRLQVTGQGALSLARLMYRHCVGIRMGEHSGDAAAVSLPPDALQPIGFEPENALLPASDVGFAGYRILSEYAALPEKFLYFDIALGRVTQKDRLDLYLYFDVPPDDALRRIGDANILLHTSPVANLFSSRTEPVLLDGTRTVYPLKADSRRPKTRQIHSVKSVTLATPSGETTACQPFFNATSDHFAGGVFWQLMRHSDSEGLPPGSTSVAFVDQRRRPAAKDQTTASVEVWATNGELPAQLPFGGGQPKLKLASAIDIVEKVVCLRPTTPLRKPSADHDRAWQLMSHLSLNHLSISTSGVSALRNILRLYDPGDSADTGRLIEAIDDVRCEKGLSKLGGVTVPGTDVTLVFDPQRTDPGEAVVYGAVIDRFLGCYTTINSFTRLTLMLKDRTDILARFAPRAGEGALL